MSNMSYCRFENTYSDLLECGECILDEDLSDREKRYRDRLVKLCRDIVEEYDMYNDKEDDGR